MKNKISMEDIAQKLGISKNTVSLALRGMPGINEQTRDLIVATAKGLGYNYKKSNESLKNICLILSKSTRNSVGFFNYIQFGMEDEAKKQGLNIIIYYYDENSENFDTPLSIKEGMISGVLTLGRVSRKTAKAILEFRLPVVMVDHYFDNLSLNYILTDNISSGYTVTEYLISKGCKNIGFIGNIDASISFYDRYQGFLKALKDYGIPLKKEFIIHKSMEELAVNDGKLVIQELSSSGKFPEAVFCCNDSEAITVNKAFSAMGIKVPEDISIIGFDDIEFSQNMTPELTTMRVEKELMGKKAVEKLVSIMDGGTNTTEKLLLGTTLIERNSVQKGLKK